MTAKRTFTGVTAAAIALHAAQALAQGASPPPPPPRITPVTAAAPVVAPAPLLVAGARTPPPPPKVVVPASALPPSDSAVALCNNGTFVMEPGTPADCASRGGLRVAMARRGKPPVLRASPSTAVRAALVEQAPPAGATMRCKDGTYLSGTASADRCANNGGLAAVLPVRPAVPPPAAAQRRP